MDPRIIATVTNYCSGKLPLANAKLGQEYYKASMPLCVIDAVFSISVKYESVRNTIRRVCDNFNIARDAREPSVVPDIKDQVSTTAFLNLLGDRPPDVLAREVYGNRQRTSATNGILKAEAVTRFLNVLRDFGAEYFQHIPSLLNNERFEKRIMDIPGQRSGLSLQYFFMLAGNDDLIKPDRMIIRFLEDATGQMFHDKECQTILRAATEELNKRGYNITPRLLDYKIWEYQREIPVKKEKSRGKIFAVGSQVDLS